MENVWFYTFSTSAQVMAALVGLFAVFVVYKIQDFSGLLNSTRNSIRDLLPYISANTDRYQSISANESIAMSDLELLNHFDELLKISVSKPASTIGEPNFNRRVYDLFESLVVAKKFMFADLKDILIIGFGIIGLSLSLLVSTRILFTLTWLPYLVIWLFLGLFLFSLWAIGKRIYDITTRSEYY